MSRTKTLQIRLSTNEHKILQNYAEELEVSMADVLRMYINTLTTIHPISDLTVQSGTSCRTS